MNIKGWLVRGAKGANIDCEYSGSVCCRDLDWILDSDIDEII
jgi:hypothetical protein